LEAVEFWPDVPDEYDDEDREALCADCGEDTFGTDDGDWYMVRDEVWTAAGMPAESGAMYLHRRCLENRLGRRLTREDYTGAPINREILAELEWAAGVLTGPLLTAERYVNAGDLDPDHYYDPEHPKPGAVTIWASSPPRAWAWLVSVVRAFRCGVCACQRDLTEAPAS
jgi:hypothetical protein